MTFIGVNDEGSPTYPLKELENGFVVPDATVAEIQRDHQRQISNQVACATTAEKLGYEFFFQSEHHFALLGAISPNPVLTQTAVAAQTEEIRLVQMANILPWHEPVRLAEQTAMLDLISEGRTEVGIGRGFGSREADTLGQYWGGTVEDPPKNHASFEEKYEILHNAWTEDFLTHRGQFHQIPPTYTEWEHNQEYFYLADDVCEYSPDDCLEVQGDKTTLSALPVMPHPHQQPHPQLWMPTMSPHSIKWAAERGINGCCHCHDFADMKETIDRYHEVAEEADWPDHRPAHDGEPFRRGWDGDRRRGVAAILRIFNTEVADEETFERWKLGVEFGLSSTKSMRSPEHADAVKIDAEEMLEAVDSPIVGDTEEIVDQLARYREVCGYEDFIVIRQTKVTGMTHEEGQVQLRAFAEDVAPYFEDQAVAE